jgi:hypothetical protein|tara:strand:+ start:171 stop:359 length:189 start_codon:yes stop_codon:yes gene_type:complete
MIINITYNKIDGTIVIVDDESLMEAVVSKTTDTDTEVSIEIALNVSAYQEQFNTEDIDGNNN